MEKSLSGFYRDKSHKDGYRSECKACQKAYVKKWYVANREQQKVYNKKWQVANRERQRDYHLNHKYGLSPEDYNALFEAQAGCCAICGRHESELKQKLHVDHDHVTGEIRGLLCRGCNTAIGLLCDDPDTIDKASDYIRRGYAVDVCDPSSLG